MRIGLFGGTFDPPHLGHVTMAEKAVRAVELDRLIIMPDRIPPHKQVSEGFASGEDRLEMCRLAFGGIAASQVSDWELGQSGKSYSVYTVRHLCREFPEDRIYFIMGSDMLTSFEKWYRYEELLELCGLICVSRETGDRDELEAAAERLRAQGGEVIIADAEPFEASSTQVRRLAAEGGELSGLVSGPVIRYIKEHGLYGSCERKGIMEYTIGGHRLVWEFDESETDVSKQKDNNLYIPGVWSMRDTVGRDELCVGCEILGEDLFRFRTFNGITFTMRVEGARVVLAEKGFGK